MQSSAGFAETRESLNDETLLANNRLIALQQELDALKNEFARWIKEF
jgi:hypothetical protein